MRQLSNDFVKATANTAWQQIKATASPDVIGSWGISELYAQEITANVEGDTLHMAALVMRVQGFALSGFAIVALNEGKDLYNIYTAESEDAELHEFRREVYCDSLAECLDKCIERGEMTEAQYKERIQQAYFI